MDQTQTVLAIIVLAVAGLVFLVLEIITPTFGILVGLGLVALGAAVVFCFSLSTMLGLAAIVLLVVAIPAYLVLMVKLLPRSPLGRRLFLGTAPEATGTGTPEADHHESLVGREGVTETTLRPSGAIRIDGRRVIATAESGMIEQGQTVRVVRAVGMNVVVRPADEA